MMDEDQDQVDGGSSGTNSRTYVICCQRLDDL